MRWLILEDALCDKRGHYYHYIKTFKNGLEMLGDTVDICIEKRAEDWLVDNLNARKELPLSIWRRMSDAAPKWKKIARYPHHGWETYKAWSKILKQNHRADVIFVPSVFTHHLCGIVPYLLKHAPRSDSKYLLFFPCTPIEYNKLKDKAVAPNITSKIFPWLLKKLKPLVLAKKVVLGVETNSMKEALEELTGLPFVYLPHPVTENSNMSLTSINLKDKSKERYNFGAYGFARHEKGSDLLQDAIKSYLNDHPDANITFSVQWIGSFKDSKGNTVTQDKDLTCNQRVYYINQIFDPNGGLEKQLVQTDAMVLPYRMSYKYRLSRVVIEAMTYGIPVIITPGTTLEEQARDHGACIVCKDSTAESVAEAIEEMANNMGKFLKEAESKRRNAVEHFSVKQFRMLLLTYLNTQN